MTKRIWRNMPQAQKDKISQAHKGRTQSYQTRELISQGMRRYWSKIPTLILPTSGTTGTTPTF